MSDEALLRAVQQAERDHEQRQSKRLKVPDNLYQRVGGETGSWVCSTELTCAKQERSTLTRDGGKTVTGVERRATRSDVEDSPVSKVIISGYLTARSFGYCTFQTDKKLSD